VKKRRTGYQAGGEVDELSDYQGESSPEIRSAPDTPQQDINYDDRWLQQVENVEGAMKDMGSIPDPDLDQSGFGIRQDENWPYTEEGKEDPTPGRRAGLRPRSYRRGGLVHGDRENVVLRRVAGRPSGSVMPTGYKKRYALKEYAYGGPVVGDRGTSSSASTSGSASSSGGPLAMSAALDSRSHNPAHFAEDHEAISTRPEGAPSVPDEFSYKRGGTVKKKKRKKTGYQEGGEVDDEEDQPAQEEAPVAAEEPPPPPPEEAPPLPPPTGYNAAEPDQADRDAAALADQGAVAKEPTGYQSQAQPEEQDPGQILKDILDWTRRTLKLPGYTAPTATVERPETAEPETTGGGPAPTPAAEAPLAPVPMPPSGLGRGPPTGPPVEAVRPFQNPNANLEEAVPGMSPAERRALTGTQGAEPAQPRSPAAPTPAQTPPTAPAAAAAPGEQQALADYLKGTRNFTPQQMTDLLNATSAQHPDLDMNGAIHKTFQDLTSKGDTDGASRFLQSMRPSYDNVRAAMIAASAHGDYGTALRLAEHLNNLVPNGRQTSFVQTEDGRVTAIVRPSDGSPTRTFSMTPQQFDKYVSSPNTLFDHVAEKGVEATLAGAGAQAAAPGAATRQPTQPTPTGAAPAAAPAAAPTTAPAATAPTTRGGLAPSEVYEPTRPTPANVPLPTSRPSGPGRVDVEGNLIGPPRGAPVPPEAAANPPGRYDVTGRRLDDPFNPPPARTNGQAGPPRTGYDRTQPPQAAPQRTGYDQASRTAGRNVPTRFDYGRDVRDPDGWPSGIPRGGQFANTPGNRNRDWAEPVTFGRTGHVSSVGRPGSKPVYSAVGPDGIMHEYDVGHDGLPLAQQGQPGWHPPSRGQPGWTGTETQANAPGNFVPGRDPVTGGRTVPRLAPTTPETQGQAPDQRAQATTAPARSNDPAYQKALQDYQLQKRAFDAYPHVEDRDKREKLYRQLHEDAARQQRHDENVRYRSTFEQRSELEQRKIQARSDDLDKRLQATTNENTWKQMSRMLSDEDKQRGLLLRQNRSQWAKDNPGIPYPWDQRPEEREFVNRMFDMGARSNLFQQLQQPRTPTTAPTAPAPAPAPAQTAPQGGGEMRPAPATPPVDLNTYTGKDPPYAAPPGQKWQRSPSTGKWRPVPIQ
jgi:hypothetical protein